MDGHWSVHPEKKLFAYENENNEKKVGDILIGLCSHVLSSTKSGSYSVVGLMVNLYNKSTLQASLVFG